MHSTLTWSDRRPPPRRRRDRQKNDFSPHIRTIGATPRSSAGDVCEWSFARTHPSGVFHQMDEQAELRRGAVTTLCREESRLRRAR